MLCRNIPGNNKYKGRHNQLNNYDFLNHFWKDTVSEVFRKVVSAPWPRFPFIIVYFLNDLFTFCEKNHFLGSTIQTMLLKQCCRHGKTPHEYLIVMLKMRLFSDMHWRSLATRGHDHWDAMHDEWKLLHHTHWPSGHIFYPYKYLFSFWLVLNVTTFP